MTRTWLRRAGWVALVVAVVLCFAGAFQHGLWTPDEPREAEIGREMLDSHFSAVPTLGGEPFLEKPPLYAWITAASYSVFGVSAGAARVPSALFSVGAIFVAYLLGKRAAGRLAGLCSAIALATMWQFSETSHKAVLDTGLTFFVAAGHLAFLDIRCQAPSVGSAGPGSAGPPPVRSPEDRCLAPYFAIGVLSGLAFLTKAWIGPALLCAPPILASVALREWGFVKRVLPRAFVAAVLGVAAFGAPWVFAVAHTPGGGWGAVKECLWTEYVGRSIGGEEFRKQGHANPPWYYTHTALYVAVPWILALPAALKGGALTRSWRGGRTLWVGLIFVAGVVLLSIPSGKRDIYLLPLLPAAAVVPGVWLSRVGSRRGGAWDKGTVVSLAWFALVVLVCVGIVTPPLLSTYPDIPLAKTLLGVSVPLVAVAVLVFLRVRPWVRRVAWGLVAVHICLHTFVGPAVDPLRDMSRGAAEVSALVAESEPLLAFSADETTLAVVPFYSRRLVANADRPADALRALESGPSKHLLVMDKDVKRMGRALEARLTLVKTVRLSATRDVNVYAYKP